MTGASGTKSKCIIWVSTPGTRGNIFVMQTGENVSFVVNHLVADTFASIQSSHCRPKENKASRCDRINYMVDPVSIETQLTNLYTHDILKPIFDARGSEAPWLFDEIFEELGKLGEPLLGAHDEKKNDEGFVKQDYVCTLKWRGQSTEDVITAGGATPTLAALRCLMDALYRVRKETEKFSREL